MRYVIIGQDGIVTNSVIWDGVSSYNPGEGLIIVQSDTGGIADKYLDGIFISA